MRQPSTKAKPCRAHVCLPELRDSGRRARWTLAASRPLSAVYPAQDKLSTSSTLGAAMVILIKRSFDGKNNGLIFLSWLEEPLAPFPCCSLQPLRFPHCQQPVVNLPTHEARTGHCWAWHLFLNPTAKTFSEPNIRPWKNNPYEFQMTLAKSPTHPSNSCTE